MQPAKWAKAAGINDYRPLSRARVRRSSSWGLRPRLYAVACFAGSTK